VGGGSSQVPLHLQEIYTIITTDYDLLKDTTRRLPNAQSHNQETSNAQSQLKETYNNITWSNKKIFLSLNLT